MSSGRRQMLMQRLLLEQEDSPLASFIYQRPIQLYFCSGTILALLRTDRQPAISLGLQQLYFGGPRS